MTELFETQAQNADPVFTRLRSDPQLHEERQFIEALWARFKPYADHHFLKAFSYQCIPRFWEMYLGWALLERGLTLIPKKQSGQTGPDLCLSIDSRHIWAEATAPAPGTGPDAVPPMDLPGGWIPERAIVLRFRSALEDKYRKWQEYLHAGHVQSDQPFVIAVNGAQIPGADTNFPDDIPYPIQAVLPFGPRSVSLDRKTMEVVRQGFSYRDQIIKLSASPVSTNAFLNPAYACISGLIFSTVGPYSVWRMRENRLSFLHNPLASAPLPVGWLGTGIEWWIEEDELRKRTWEASPYSGKGGHC